MKLTSNIAGVLLGLAFNVIGLNYFFHFFQIPSPPAGSLPAMFLGAMISSGYFGFVKGLEIMGGILVAIPRTRLLGLLTLGPSIVNILCFHVFLTKGAGLFGPPLLVAALSLFLLWVHRPALSSLLRSQGDRSEAVGSARRGGIASDKNSATRETATIPSIRSIPR